MNTSSTTVFVLLFLEYLFYSLLNQREIHITAAPVDMVKKKLVQKRKVIRMFVSSLLSNQKNAQTKFFVL